MVSSMSAIMIIPIVLLIIAHAGFVSCGSVSFTGSKLGTKEYIREQSAMSFAINDRLAILKKYKVWEPRPLLCATFASSKVITNILKDNIKLMDGKCEWAVVYYDNDEAEITKRCAELTNTVHCRMFPMGTRTNVTVPGSSTNVTLSIPKTVLYTALLPYLAFYKRVLLMDEDMLLTGFNVTTFTSVWDCAFGQNPPLVVQPLIANSEKHIPYVNADVWKNHSDVMAAEVGLVEQQVPAFDSIFFEWFVRRVLSQTYSIALTSGADWGADRSWCNAARMYSAVVLGQNEKDTVGCAVLLKDGGIIHTNGRTLAVKRANRNHHATIAWKGVQQYINLFPTWVVTDIMGTCNPLKEGSTLRKYYSVNQTCVVDKARVSS